MFENLQKQAPVSQPLQQTINPQEQMMKQLQEYKSKLSMLRNAQNPTAMIQQMMESNPQLKNIMDQANALYHGDVSAYFKAECRKHGMTDEQMQSFLTNFTAAMK